MSKGHALVIGLNSVDPKHYDNWDGKLEVCENDANDMETLAKGNKFTTKKLLTSSATRKNVIKEMNAAAKKLKSGDIFMIYYSGHGGNEIPDKNKDEDDPWADKYDESWCLFDAQLIDDELYFQWKKFRKGVRILLISDSCFCGDIAKIVQTTARKSKAMETEIGNKTYLNNKKFYDKVLKALESKELKQFKSTGKTKNKITATLLQIGSSQEGQTSSAETDHFPKNSLFTGVFLDKIKDKKIKSYQQLISVLKQSMPDYQTPNEQILGSPTIKILLQKPFRI